MAAARQGVEDTAQERILFGQGGEDRTTAQHLASLFQRFQITPVSVALLDRLDPSRSRESTLVYTYLSQVGEERLGSRSPAPPFEL
jgi:hypothetical protein